MTRVSWCLTASIDGEIKTIFPGAIDPTDLDAITPIVRRAVERRIAVEAAIRAGDLIDASPSVEPCRAKREPAKLDTIMTQGEIARVQGYTGDCCDNCGQFKMKRNGACLSCDACGTTTGCS